MGPAQRLRRNPAATDRDGAGTRISHLFPDQRPAATTDSSRRHPDVRLNVDFDLTLTVLADLLYRQLAERLKGFGRTSPSKLFRKFVDTPGDIQITAKEVVVRLNKRAHNPLLKEAGLT